MNEWIYFSLGIVVGYLLYPVLRGLYRQLQRRQFKPRLLVPYQPEQRDRRD